MYIDLHLNYPLFLADFYRTWVFLIDFRKKNIQISNFVNIRPVGGDLFHADGQTCKTKLLVALRDIANAPKIHSRYKTVTRDSRSELRERQKLFAFRSGSLLRLSYTVIHT